MAVPVAARVQFITRQKLQERANALAGVGACTLALGIPTYRHTMNGATIAPPEVAVAEPDELVFDGFAAAFDPEAGVSA